VVDVDAGDKGGGSASEYAYLDPGRADYLLFGDASYIFFLGGSGSASEYAYLDPGRADYLPFGDASYIFYLGAIYS
jgi:hypothetical protein